MSASRQGKEAEKRVRSDLELNGYRVVRIADRDVLLSPRNLERFWSLVLFPVDGEDSCWPWQGYLQVTNYGAISFGGRGGRNVFPAHRLAYLLLRGPIPPGYETDHVCHTQDTDCPAGVACQHRRCVNPWHLELVTHVENMARIGSRLVRCRRGHDLTPENTYTNPTTKRRTCRICIKVRYPKPKGRAVQPCGTRGAYRRHKAAGEQPCAPCVQANFEYESARWQRRKAAA